MSPPAPVLKYHTVIRRSWPRCHLDYCAVRGNRRAVVDCWHIVYEEDETWNECCHSDESHLELCTTEIRTLECLNWARMLWCNCVSGKLPKLWTTALYLQLAEEICVEDYTSGCRMKPPNLFPELQKLDFVFFCRLLRGNKFGLFSGGNLTPPTIISSNLVAASRKVSHLPLPQTTAPPPSSFWKHLKMSLPLFAPWVFVQPDMIRVWDQVSLLISSSSSRGYLISAVLEPGAPVSTQQEWSTHKSLSPQSKTGVWVWFWPMHWRLGLGEIGQMDLNLKFKTRTVGNW